MIDLHTHSTESDGTLTPEELMALAKESGLSAIALTDHDTVGGLPKARAAAKKLHLEFVPGIEFSTGHLGREIHILGYYIQESDPAFLTQLNVFIRRRDARNEKMAALLQKEGFGISMEALSPAA